MTATTDRCPGCHGSGIEMSGVTYAGMSEYVGCHECGPECPDDCGCRASDATERPESIAPRHPGATQSPDGSQGATEGLRGAEGATGPTSDVRPSPPARDAVSDAEAAEWAALADAVTEGSWHFIALARTAVPRLLADRERLTGEASRVPVLLADKAALMGDVDRLTAERDGARLMRVIATRAFETTRRVLQEASGLPDDIDDPDCRDEMVLALRPRAEKAEAEVARLRQSRDTWERVEAETRAEMHTRLAEHRDAVEVLKLRLSEVAAERDRARSVAVALEAEVERLRAGIEARVVGWSSYRTDPASLTAASCAESLRRLLTPPDAQEPAQEPRTGAGGPGVPDEGCEAVSGQQWAVVEAPLDGGE